jgi:hypothetical protein
VKDHRASLTTRAAVDRIAMSRSKAKRQCSSLGDAAVPSDQWPTAIMNSVIGSGAPPNCGFNITGEPGRSAPQTLGSDWGM